MAESNYTSLGLRLVWSLKADTSALAGKTTVPWLASKQLRKYPHAAINGKMHALLMCLIGKEMYAAVRKGLYG